MNILHINSYYIGGKFYKNLYECQDENNNLIVYVPTSSYEKFDFDYGNYTTISRNHNKYDRVIFCVKHGKILNDFIVKMEGKNVDFIHAHSLFSNGYIAYKYKKIKNIPYIVAVRNTDVNVFFKKMLHMKKLGVEIMKESSAIIFISEPYKKEVFDKYVPNQLKESLYKKSYVIPNGIDDFWINNKKSKVLNKNNNINLVYVGEINKNKNVLTTVEAIKKMILKGYKVEFTIIGKISDVKIYNQINKFEFVNYLGVKTKEEILEIYKKQDIFVMPSIHETFGLVYAEAMSQGLPIIYTRGQGFDGQFLDGEVGYAVDCNDPNDIVNKILEIYKCYDEMSSNCSRKCKHFNWKQLKKSYEEIYNKSFYK